MAIRLLTSDASGELIWRVFHSDVPPYAILSHTWENEEVGYEDLVSGSAKQKAGFKKILFCGEQVKRDDLRYFWIDTCCINQWDLDERSRAINSMFRWYQNADRCYVYLPDVPTPDVHIPDLDLSTWEAYFLKSRWFKRGWTLQELLAPTSIEFFSSRLQRLGDRVSLEEQIHKATKIPIEALRGQPLHKFSVEERLSWTGERETKEEEDGAYCLLGILGVEMPTIYGEGKENALRRLQTEVKRSLDQNPVTTVPFLVPFNRNADFSGRDSQLAQLDSKLFHDGPMRKVAITGIGGIGKTQLALELAYRIRAKYKDCSIFWIAAADPESLRQAYMHIARRVNIPGWQDEKADVSSLVQRHLSKASVGQWLLIYDNVTISSWSAEYLPESEQGQVVFTTNDMSAAIKLASPNIIEVPEGDQDVAQRMLQKRLNFRSLADEQADADILLKKLTYLPLAIELAAAYMKQNQTTIKDYSSLFDKHHKERIALYKGASVAEEQDREAKSPVATTWLISFEKVRSCNTLAVKYLSLMACVDRKDIPESLLLKTSSAEKSAALRALIDYSLVVKCPAGSALDVHRLIHLATRNWLREQDLLDQSSHEAIARLLDIFPGADHEHRSMWRRLLPHANFALEWGTTGEENEARINLVLRCARSLYYDGRFDEAEGYFQQALRYHKMLGDEHLATLSIMVNLASTYGKQGRWTAAEELEMQVIEIRKEKLGADHPDTLTAMANLALTYQNQGQWKAAEELEVQVIELRKEKLGPEHPDTLTVMANLALTYQSQGRWAAAEELAVQVVEIRKKKHGVEHADTLTSMANLASIFWSQGRLAAAEELGVQVMEIRMKKLGVDHPDTLTSLANLASTYFDQGRLAAAEELGVVVVETRKKKLGADHPSTLTSMANLAATFCMRDQWTKGAELGVQVMEIRREKFGADHPDTLTSMNNLAFIWKKQGHLAAAEELEAEVVETRRKKLGPDHPNTLTSENNLACTWKEQGRDEEAIRLMAECVSARTRVLGARHQSTLSSSEILLSWKAERLDIDQGVA